MSSAGRSVQDIKEGEEDGKDNPSDLEDGQDGCEDDASDERQISDLEVIHNLYISGLEDNKKKHRLFYLFSHS